MKERDNSGQIAKEAANLLEAAKMVLEECEQFLGEMRTTFAYNNSAKSLRGKIYAVLLLEQMSVQMPVNMQRGYHKDKEKVLADFEEFKRALTELSPEADKKSKLLILEKLKELLKGIKYFTARFDFKQEDFLREMVEELAGLFPKLNAYKDAIQVQIPNLETVSSDTRKIVVVTQALLTMPGKIEERRKK